MGSKSALFPAGVGVGGAGNRDTVVSSVLLGLAVRVWIVVLQVQELIPDIAQHFLGILCTVFLQNGCSLQCHSLYVGKEKGGNVCKSDPVKPVFKDVRSYRMPVLSFNCSNSSREGRYLAAKSVHLSNFGVSFYWLYNNDHSWSV